MFHVFFVVVVVLATYAGYSIMNWHIAHAIMSFNIETVHQIQFCSPSWICCQDWFSKQLVYLRGLLSCTSITIMSNSTHQMKL